MSSATTPTARELALVGSTENKEFAYIMCGSDAFIYLLEKLSLLRPAYSDKVLVLIIAFLCFCKWLFSSLACEFYVHRVKW